MKTTALIDARLQDVVVEAQYDAAVERRLEPWLWYGGALLGIAGSAATLVHGTYMLILPLWISVGVVTSEIVGSRARRRRALARAARFEELIARLESA